VIPDFPRLPDLYLSSNAAEGQGGITKTEDILTRNASRSLLAEQ